MRTFRILLLLLLMIALSGCRSALREDFAAQLIPSPTAEPPVLRVYLADEATLSTMPLDAYLTGVVAGEMPNTWPLEALKAQAILARTYVLKFIAEKDSKYPGADISTDVTEAQAYNASAVNDRIQQAVAETTGLILLTQEGDLPWPWFHSHSGGMTETARDGIDWHSDEPAYTRITQGMEAESAAWSAEFTQEEFIAACRSTGAEVTSAHSVRVAQKGKSGRAVTLTVDGVPVNAARLRISLGSSKMRSTLLTALSVEDDIIHLSGQGYGHGVGMSQWGAKALAEQGWPAEKIALHYYKGLQVVKAW